MDAVGSKDVEKAVEKLIEETAKQGRNAATTVITAVAGVVGVTTLAAIVIMSDESLKRRAQQQASMVLDATGKIVTAYSRLAANIAPQVSTLEDRIRSAANQWDQIKNSSAGTR